MAVNNWSFNGSGSWGTAADWSLGVLPTNLDTVNIAVPGVTVSVDAGVIANAYQLTTQSANLAVTGGTLYTVHLATFNGGYSQTAGTYTAGGQGAVFNGAVSQTGGLIDVVTGALKLEQGGSLSGTLSGAGVLELAGGTTYFGAGFVSNLSTILADPNAKLGFNTDFKDTRNLSLQNGVLDLFGHKLTLSGTTLLSGVAGSGSIAESGTLTLGTTLYATTLDNGLVLTLTGSATQANQLFLGATDAGAKISVAKSGHYAINGNWNIYNPSNVGSISNAGVFAKTGGGKVSQIATSFSSTGTLQTNVGELQLDGLVNSLSGTVSGNGTLGIGAQGTQGGQTTLGKVSLTEAALSLHAGNLILNGPQTYAGEWDMTGGVLNLNATKATLTLSGRANFDGGVVTGYGGTLILNGATELDNVTIGGPGKIKIAGTVDQTGTINFGQSSNPEADIASGASWQIEGDGNILGFFGLINNAGLFSDPNGSGDAIVQAELASTGTVTANNSTLTLEGGNVLGGTLSGTGLIDIAGATTLQAGLALKVAALDVSNLVVLGGNLADAGIFSEYGPGVIDTAGHSLALTGTVSLDGGQLTDNGSVSSAGQTTLGNYVVTGGAELLISGRADQTGALVLQNGAGAGTLGVAAGGAYTVLDDYDVVGAGALAISGTFTESGTGISNIGAAVTLATGGALVALDRTLTLTDGGSLSGTLGGTGDINLNSGTFTLAAGFTALSAGLQVTGNALATLAANQTYGGTFLSNGGATLSLASHTLSLTGTSLLGGFIDGPGVLLASGGTTLASTNVVANGTLMVTGAAEQMFNVQVGDPQGMPSSASLVVGGAYGLDNNAGIMGNGTLMVTSSGTLSSTGDGTSQIATSIVDAGTIAANLGTLQVLGAVSGAGRFAIGGLGTLDFSNNATIGIGTGVAFAGAGAILRIDDLAGFGATLSNFATNDVIQLTGLDGASVTGTYGNAAHTQLLVSDAQNRSITLNFSTAQTLSSISFTAGVNDIALVIHH